MTRIEAPASTRPVWRFGVFEVDTHRVELRRNGIPIKLREQSFQVLVHLLEHAGDIVTREELRRLLWPSDTFVDFDHSLNTAVMKLREALGDPIETPIYVETIPKRGYRFVAPIAASVDQTSRPPTVEAEVKPQQNNAIAEPGPANPVVAARPHHRLRLGLVTFGVLLIAVMTGLVFLRTRNLFLSSQSQAGTAPSYRIDSVTTVRGRVKNPAITADGRDVAYAWNGGGGDHYDIYVQRIGSSMPMRLTYIKSGFVGFPAWSPDQSEIAFTRCDGVNDGVYLVPALGGLERKLTSTSCQYHVPTPVVWLPGSRMLMVDRCPASGLNGLALFSMDTGEKKCIADLGATEWDRRYIYSVSPDQKTVAFVTSTESPCVLYTLQVSGGSPRRVLEDNDNCEDVVWTPDGKEIVFLALRTGFLSVRQIPANGGRIRESIYPSVGTFSKDGRRLVYAEETNGEPMTIWRADLASPGGRVISNRKLIATQSPELDPQPSPDGARLVWAERRAGIEELWTGSATGENPLQLTHLNSYSGTPRWSPDGRWIAFDSYTPAGPQIFIIDIEGRNLRAITQGPFIHVVPSWSRDGKSLYFSSIRTGREVWKHSLDTGKESQLTTHGGINVFESFDGQTVYFAKFDHAGIWSIPSSGGRERLVLEGRPQVLHWGSWAVTKMGIYLLNPDVVPRARIEFYDFTTRRISPVLSLEKSEVFGGSNLSATADGKTFYYTQWDRQSVIKMMEVSR